MATLPSTLKEALPTKIKVRRWLCGRRFATNSVRKRSYRAMLRVEGAEFRLPTKPQEVPEITFQPANLKTASKNLEDLVVISLQV
ncbi:hypothetical protein PIB30_045636 [Stylosanthes scabra]|uniref:Uncharacterized protein n=1 Tax=Stylosanthes scabra TaxID=79078 RepID=A0ABU6VH51_9FABA|nr:hypothetical protein [Stylosanthes scabra]